MSAVAAFHARDQETSAALLRLPVQCGQCSTVCPVGAIVEHTEWRQVLDELETRKKVQMQMHLPLFLP